MKVFVSHHHGDAERLGEAKQFLSAYGIDLFLAHEDIEIGEHDLNTIKNEIFNCDAFLIIGNQRAEESVYCNQEIGMALGKEKQIVSTVSRGGAPWGFISRQQAMRYQNIDETFFEKLFNVFFKLASPDSVLGLKKQCLEILNIKAFTTDRARNQDRVVLEFDNWDDEGYKTTFHITKDDVRLGRIKIGFAGQLLNHPTLPALPSTFYFLRDDFFSRITWEDNDISEEQSVALSILLNDIDHNPDLRKRFSSEDVLITSLDRQDGV